MSFCWPQSGLYGVTAYTGAQRTQEIVIRMELGADRINVVQMVLAGASRRVFVGLVLGIFRGRDSGSPRGLHFADESAKNGVAAKW
ncbi:MAG: hypothetical protein LAO76_19315 [Acidobacteriia bacterium]|nr:hypothetical protein [Terriglobia bacterium]